MKRKCFTLKRLSIWYLPYPSFPYLGSTARWVLCFTLAVLAVFDSLSSPCVEAGAAGYNLTCTCTLPSDETTTEYTTCFGSPAAGGIDFGICCWQNFVYQVPNSPYTQCTLKSWVPIVNSPPPSKYNGPSPKLTPPPITTKPGKGKPSSPTKTTCSCSKPPNNIVLRKYAMCYAGTNLRKCCNKAHPSWNCKV